MESAYEAFQEGTRLLESENPHAAVVALERARDLEPDKASVRETLARAYFRTGRFPAAGAEFARTVEIDPVNDYAHFGLGLCLLRQGDRLGARRHLSSRWRCAPTRPTTGARSRARSTSEPERASRAGYPGEQRAWPELARGGAVRRSRSGAENERRAGRLLRPRRRHLAG